MIEHFWNSKKLLENTEKKEINKAGIFVTIFYSRWDKLILKI